MPWLPAAKRRPLHHPPEAPTPENPVNAFAVEAFKRLRLLLTLYKTGEQLLPAGAAAADAQEERACRDSILVGCASAGYPADRGCTSSALSRSGRRSCSAAHSGV